MLSFNSKPFGSNFSNYILYKIGAILLTIEPMKLTMLVLLTSTSRYFCNYFYNCFDLIVDLNQYVRRAFLAKICIFLEKLSKCTNMHYPGPSHYLLEAIRIVYVIIRELRFFSLVASLQPYFPMWQKNTTSKSFYCR